MILPTTLYHRILTIFAVVILLILIGLSMAWCGKSKEAQRLKAESKVAEAQANAGKKATDIQADATRNQQATDDQTRINQGTILNADNAKQDAGDAGRKLTNALCARRVYANHPQCKP